MIGGHALDANDKDTYLSVMNTISARLPMVIAKVNWYQVLTGDIKIAYLYANCDINICTWVGPKFELNGFKELKTEFIKKCKRQFMACH